MDALQQPYTSDLHRKKSTTQTDASLMNLTNRTMKKTIAILLFALPLSLVAQTWQTAVVRADELKKIQAHTAYSYIINDSIALTITPELNEFYITTRGAAFSPMLYSGMQKPTIKATIGYYGPDSAIITTEKVTMTLSLADHRATIYEKNRKKQRSYTPSLTSS